MALEEVTFEIRSRRGGREARERVGGTAFQVERWSKVLSANLLSIGETAWRPEWERGGKGVDPGAG